MKKIILALSFIFFVLGCYSSGIATEDENREIWEMGTFKPIMMLLGKTDFPKGNRYIIEYFPDKNKANVFFLYDDKVYVINIEKTKLAEYNLFTDKGNFIIFKRMTKLEKYPEELYVFLSNDDKKNYKKREMLGHYDGHYRKKSNNLDIYNNLPAYISKLREQYEFAKQEQEYFDKVRKDEEDMKKNK